MKKRIVILAGILVLAVSASAQQQGQGGTPEERAKRSAERLTERLSLTPEQVAKVDSIYLAYEKEVQPIREKEWPDRQARREAMRPFNEKRTEQLKAVLTEEQFKKMQETTRQSRRSGGEQP